MKNPNAVSLGSMTSQKKAVSPAENARKATEARKAAAALRRAQKAAQTPDPPA